MISLPDFKEKQILIIQTKRSAENKINFWNDNIKFTRDGQTINRASCYRIFAIFIIGDISITTTLINRCKRYGISIFLLNHSLEEYANILSQTEGNYLLRSRQYEFKNDLYLSKNLVKNKITNQILLLKKNKNYLSSILNSSLNKINEVKNNQELLGIEGNCSREFFSKYFVNIGWQKRSPRTKIDIPNTLLDIGYYYLFNFIDSLLRLYGFDTYKGFYHKLFFQRKSLSCDLIEPFRYIIEKQLLKSYNLKQVNVKDFKIKDGRFYLKNDKNQKYCEIFLQAILNYREEIYSYVKSFYHFMLDQSKPIPSHHLKIR